MIPVAPDTFKIELLWFIGFPEEVEVSIKDDDDADEDLWSASRSVC